MDDIEDRTPDANEVFQAARDYFEAERDEHAAMAKCDVSPAYHCWRESQRTEKARDKLADVFARYVDARVRAVLKEKVNE